MQTSEYAELAENGFVAGDSAARERLGKVKGRALMSNLVAHLVRLPRVLKRVEVRTLDLLELLPHPVARVALAREHVLEHDVRLDDGLAPLTRAPASCERFDMPPTRR